MKIKAHSPWPLGRTVSAASLLSMCPDVLVILLGTEAQLCSAGYGSCEGSSDTSWVCARVTDSKPLIGTGSEHISEE